MRTLWRRFWSWMLRVSARNLGYNLESSDLILTEPIERDRLWRNYLLYKFGQIPPKVRERLFGDLNPIRDRRDAARPDRDVAHWRS